MQLSKCFTKLKKICKNPWIIIPYAGNLNLLNWMPDSWYLKGCFHTYMGYKLNLKNPQTFNEKLQWLKIHDRNPVHTQMVDKFLVRDYIKKTIGEKYLIPLLGVWDSFDEIDFNTLPKQFVLKTNHDSGTVIICKDKNSFDKDAARDKINDRIGRNYYYLSREWPYKNISPKIIAEQYMVDSKTFREDSSLNVYKFMTFNGEPRIVQTIQNDKLPSESIDYFDCDWKLLKIRQNFPNSTVPMTKPETFDEMLGLVRKLSHGFRFLRVDLYEINGKVYFSEFTFYSDAGFAKFEPKEIDKLLGNWISLKKNKTID